MSKCLMQKEDGGPIVSVALSDWQRYRMEGYIFRNDPEAPAEFAAQNHAQPERTAKKKAKKKASKKKS